MAKDGPTGDAHTGRPGEGVRLVNPSVCRGSTVVFPTYAEFTARSRPFFYGRMGTPTHAALCESVAALEHADHVTLAPSGLAAVTLAILSFCEAGGHLLVTDSAYDPTRAFCEGMLRTYGVETEFYDPRADVAPLIRPNTSAILAESPGSLTFEVQDLRALAGHGVPVIVDNTWSAGAYLKPLDLGCAVSVQAATKYLGGHSDVFLGTVAANGRVGARVQRTARQLGLATSPDDAALVHRGMRTLHRRLAVHEETGLGLARWLEAREEIAGVLHPGLPSHPDHALFARDFTGSTGLFAARLRRTDAAYVAAFLDSLTLFGMGYSWGGYESLCIPTWPDRHRTVGPVAPGQWLRFHAGLEALPDLTADLARGFAAANAIPEAA